MSGMQRRKGREGENESRKVFTGHGHTVKPLQAGRNGRDDTGDYIVECEIFHVKDVGGHTRSTVVLLCDSKRREKVRVVEWSRGIEACAQAGEIPVVVWRQSREPWRVTLLADDFARLLTR